MLPLLRPLQLQLLQRHLLQQEETLPPFNVVVMRSRRLQGALLGSVLRHLLLRLHRSICDRQYLVLLLVQLLVLLQGMLALLLLNELLPHLQMLHRCQRLWLALSLQPGKQLLLQECLMLVRSARTIS